MVKFLTGARSEEGDCLQANSLRDGGTSHGSTVRFRRSAIFSYSAVIGTPVVPTVTVHVVEVKSHCPPMLRVTGSGHYGRSAPLPPEIWEHTPPVAQELIVAQAAALAQRRAKVV